MILGDFARSFDIAYLQFELSQAFCDRGPLFRQVSVKRRDRLHPRHRLLLQICDQGLRLVEREGHG